MAITLDGTTGITTPGLTNTGTETVVNLTTTGNTTLGDATTDTLAVGVTGIVKDASGNVGIGTSSPDGKFTVNAGSNTASFDISASGNTVQAANIISVSTGARKALSGMQGLVGSSDISNYQGSLAFLTTPSAGSLTERMRIDSSGNLLVGTTSTGSEIGRLTVKQGADADSGGLRVIGPNSSNAWALRTGSDSQFYFGYNGTSKAKIDNSSGAYSALSDARLKENVQESVKGLSEILALRSVSYTFIDDEAKTEQIGFIAQEVEPVIPEVVSTPTSSSQYYGLNYAGLAPVLVKAIQEQQALITTLTARIETLENK